jgi:hypothetical protein
MRTFCFIKIVVFSLFGMFALNMALADVPAQNKKKSLKAVDKFSELKTNGKAIVGNKNTYVVKDQMLHLYNGEVYDTTSSFHYQYEWSVLVSEKLTKDYYNGAFENSQLELYFKDEKGRDTSQIFHNWIDTQTGWYNYGKMVFHYDEHDNMVFVAGYSWNLDAWTLMWGQEMIHEYDALGRIVSVTYSSYSGNSWDLEWKDLFEYNSNGLLESLTEQYWDFFEEEWVNGYREEYILINNEWSEVMVYEWDEWEEEWVSEFWIKDIVWLDFDNFLWLQYIMLEPDGEDWVNAYRSTADYNAMDFPLFYLEEIWDGIGWVNDWRSVWEYDSFYNITLMTDEEWWGDAWEIIWGDRYTYEYDANNNIAVEYYEVFYGSFKSWEKIHKLESWYEDVTGIPSLTNASATVNVFPNPAGNYLNMQLDEFSTGLPIQYQILDLTGRSIMAGQLTASEGGSVQLNIQDIPNGVYVLRVESGNMFENVKVIKR